MQRAVVGGIGTVMLALIAGCGSGGSAKATVVSLLEGMQKGEAGKDQVLAAFTTKARPFVEQSFSNMVEKPPISWTLGEEEAEGQTVSIKATITFKEGETQEEESGLFKLRKEDGAYRIFAMGREGAVADFEQMGGMMGTMKAMGEAMGEGMQKALEEMGEGMGTEE